MPATSTTTLADDPTTVHLSQSIDGCRERAIGAHGLTDSELKPYLDRAGDEIERLKQEYTSGSLPLLTIADQRADIDEAASAFTKLSQGAELIVFFGTGGSSLGGQTLAQLAGWNIPGIGNMSKHARPRTRFYDNLDPATLKGALEDMDLAKTRFIVTSKSGGTAETLAQTIVTLSALKAAGLSKRIPDLCLGITEPDKPGQQNGLRKLFTAHGIPMIEHHTGIGGRYSCLTNVGLMPGLARGLDAHEVRAGARDVVSGLIAATSANECPPALGAAVAVALSKEKSVNTVVLMPYADQLGRLSNWFVQLWAESLGKNGEGTTPIPAVGPLDQHSQLQLFMDGPREHMITILRIDTKNTGSTIDAGMAETAGLGYIGGRTIGDIVDAQSHAVPEALARAGRPVRTIDIKTLDERTIGALLMHFMLETIIAGRILGIDPFDQPAVELAKVLTRERLAKQS